MLSDLARPLVASKRVQVINYFVNVQRIMMVVLLLLLFVFCCSFRCFRHRNVNCSESKSHDEYFALLQ